MIYVTTILSVIDIAMSVLALIGVSIVIHNVKPVKPTVKPVIRCVKGSRPYKSIQRNGNFELDEDYESWAEKLKSDKLPDSYYRLGGTYNDDEEEK